MNEAIIRLAADLAQQAKGGEGLSSGISRVRDAVKNAIDGEDRILGKLQAILESLRGVIPGESLRYQAAIKALSVTTKLSRPEIVAALTAQQEELAALEKHLTTALPPGLAEHQAREARSHELRNEIARLRGKIAELEKEEKEIMSSRTGGATETAAIEKAVRQVLAEISTEITAVLKNLEEPREEGDAHQPIQIVEMKTDDAVEKQSSGQKGMTNQEVPYDTAKTAERRVLSADAIFPEPARPSEKKQYGAQGKQKTPSEQPRVSELKKECSVCGGGLAYDAADRKWRCYFCGFEFIKNEIPRKNEVSGSSEEKRSQSNALFAIPPSEQLFDRSTSKPSPGYWGSKKKSSPKKPPIIAKDCPSCGKKMHAHRSGKGWQCSSCGYERRI